MFGFQSKKESGAIIINGQHVASTKQCVHCGNHERIVMGSGKKRGWCVHCKGFLCGRTPCMQNCYPFEAQLEYQEARNAQKEELVRKLINKYPGIERIVFN